MLISAAADDILIFLSLFLYFFISLFIYFVFSEKLRQHFIWIVCPADNSHEMPSITKTRLFKYKENFTSKNW